MASVNAWVLDLGMGYKAAVGGRELLHLIDIQESFAVPCTPSYCRRVLFWQGKLLPLMDVAGRLNGATREMPFVAVVGYQHKRGEYPQFGALQLASPPQQIEVSDAHACNLPDETQGWSELAISCFEHQGRAMPVLNLNRLFAPIIG